MTAERLTARLRPPPLRDPRYLQAGIFFVYAILAREYFNVERTHLVMFATMAWAVALDMFLGYLCYDRVAFPLNPVIIALNVCIFVDSRAWYWYLLLVTAALLSKAFITYRRRHFFNPTNFGVVLGMQLLPNQIALNPNMFSGYLWPSIIFALAGAVVVWRARQTPLVLGWIGGFLLLGALRSQFPGMNASVAFLPMFSPGTILFVCHLLTDPATTPRATAMKVSFGFLVAVLDAVLRIIDVPQAQFYSLFIASSFLLFIRNEENRAQAAQTVPEPANPAP